jgi:hypothetical protein
MAHKSINMPAVAGSESLFLMSFDSVRNTQPVDENVNEAQNAFLPPRPVMHHGHAHQGAEYIFGADVVANFTRHNSPIQQHTNGLRQPIERV